MIFANQSKHELCVLSASGTISNASLRQPATSGGNVSYEVIFSYCKSVVLRLASLLYLHKGDMKFFFFLTLSTLCDRGELIHNTVSLLIKLKRFLIQILSLKFAYHC